MYQDSDHKPCLPRQYGDPVESQLADEDNTEEALLVMQDWITLHQYDNRYDFGDLPARIISDWEQMGYPVLPGHAEITLSVVYEALANVRDGDIYAAESYMLCAAICEAMDSMVTSNIPETPAYEILFEKVKEIIENDSGDDEYGKNGTL